MQTITYEKTPPVPAPEHEYAKLFPLLEGEARQELLDDIKANGVRDPIVFLDGKILDGRNRYYAARELLIEYPRIEFDGDDPLAYVVSKNLHRRQLSTSQRAMIAAKLANLAVGSNQHVLRVTHDNATGEEFSPPLKVAAKSVGVDRKTAQFGRTVVTRGVSKLAEAVEAGAVSVSAAAKVAELPPDEQDDIVAHGKDAILEAAKRIKEQERQERLARQRENDAAREKARAALPDSIKRAEAAKANNGSRNAAVAGKAPEETPASIKAERDRLRGELEAVRAELAEREEEAGALRKDVAGLNARLAKFEDMRVQYENGGFDKIVEGKDEQIRVLRRQVETESADKAAWKRKYDGMRKDRDAWKERALAAGYVDEIDIPVNGVAAHG